MSQRFNLVQQLGQRLVQRRETLATAESCTGGLIAAALTDVAGSSAWFDRGVVTYSNAAKQALLGVTDDVLQQHGAVSEPCTREMLRGLCQTSGADWGVAVTGIAGPSGGSPQKPVGTVWIGWQYRDASPETMLHHFHGDRAAVRQQTLDAALEGLMQRLSRL